MSAHNGRSAYREEMRWDELFADLESRLEQDDRARFEAEVADLARAEKDQLTLGDRLRAHIGAPLAWWLTGGDASVEAELLDLGADWVLVRAGSGHVLIPLRAIESVGGLSRSAAPDRRKIARKLEMGIVLRGLAQDRAGVEVRLVSGRRLTGTIDRVGADHLDLAMHPLDEARRPRAVTGIRTLRFAALVSVTVR